jgi:hypothetical protein
MIDAGHLRAKLAEAEARQQAALTSEQQMRAAAEQQRLAAHQAEGAIRALRELIAECEQAQEPEKGKRK